MRKWTVLVTAAIICSGAGSAEYDELLLNLKYAPVNSDATTAATDRLIALDPLRGDAYASRAVVRFFKKDYRGAIEASSKAISLNAKDPFWLRTAWNYRYHSDIALNDLRHALPDCIQCLQYEHTQGVANDAAKLSRFAGKYEDAEKYSALAKQYANEKPTALKELDRKGAARPISPNSLPAK